MTPEERRQYAREYRQCGKGAVIDALYRMRHLEEIRSKDRARKKNRRDGGAQQ